MIMFMSDKFIAVTNRILCQRPFLSQLERVMNFSEDSPLPKPDMLLLREKDLDEKEYESLAKEVYALCLEHQVECILHTHSETALKLGCRNIHMSLPCLEDMEKSGKWKALRGEFVKTGVSVHSREEALRGGMLGTNYLIAGHVFATDCKKGIPPRGLPFLKDVVETSRSINPEISVYGIGGMDRSKVFTVRKTGADGICIMSGYMRA